MYHVVYWVGGKRNFLYITPARPEDLASIASMLDVYPPVEKYMVHGLWPDGWGYMPQEHFGLSGYKKWEADKT